MSKYFNDFLKPITLETLRILPATAIFIEDSPAAIAAEFFLRKAFIAITRSKALFILCRFLF